MRTPRQSVAPGILERGHSGRFAGRGHGGRATARPRQESAGRRSGVPSAGERHPDAHGGVSRRRERFSVSVRGGYDAVQESGQKIEFGETRKVTLSRPDRLRVEGERSDGTKTLTVFDGKEIVLIDWTSNVYATAPQPGGVDDSIVHFVRDLGMRLPLAVLLVSQLPAELKDRVRSVDYVEKTNIYGAPVPSSRRAHRHGGFPGVGGRRRQAGAAAVRDHLQEGQGPAAVLGAVLRLESRARDRRSRRSWRSRRTGRRRSRSRRSFRAYRRRARKPSADKGAK